MPDYDKIKIKRTSTSADSLTATLQYGEPLYLKTDEMITVGSEDSGNAKDQKAVKLVNRKKEYSAEQMPDAQTAADRTIDVAANPVFAKNTSKTSTNLYAAGQGRILIDEDGTELYPKTTLSQVTDDTNSPIQETLDKKVQVDSNSQSPYAYPALGFDGTDFYITVFNPVSGYLAIDSELNGKVENDSFGTYVLALGYDSSGIYVNVTSVV